MGVFDTIDPRRSPSGPFFGLGAGGESAFDYILKSRADLVAVVAPVADEFLIPSGSYAVKVGFALNPGEVIVVQNTREVLIFGMGKSKTLQGNDANSIIRVEAGGTADLFDLDVLNNFNGNAPALRVAGTVRASHCCFTGNLAAATARGIQADTGADCSLSNSITQGGGYGIEVTSGAVLRAVNSKMLGNALQGLDIDSGVAYCSNCYIFSTSDDAACLQGAPSELYASNCEFVVPLATGVLPLRIDSGKVLRVRNCRFRGAGAAVNNGIEFVGNFGTASIDGHFENCQDCVAHSAGTVEQVSISGSADNTCTNGIDWASASIPTNGLVVSGFIFDGTTLSVGHTTASARVNYKANLRAGALATETGIVP